MDDLFAEAVERLKAGESTASIVASFPVDAQDEIGQLLAIVELAEEVAVQPLPQRSVRQRSLARAQFLQQAGALRAEMETTLGAETLAHTAAPGEQRARSAARLVGTPLGRLGQPV